MHHLEDGLWKPMHTHTDSMLNTLTFSINQIQCADRTSQNQPSEHNRCHVLTAFGKHTKHITRDASQTFEICRGSNGLRVQLPVRHLHSRVGADLEYVECQFFRLPTDLSAMPTWQILFGFRCSGHTTTWPSDTFGLNTGTAGGPLQILVLSSKYFSLSNSKWELDRTNMNIWSGVTIRVMTGIRTN